MECRLRIGLNMNVNLSDIREKVLGAPPQTIHSDVSALTSQSSDRSIGTI